MKKVENIITKEKKEKGFMNYGDIIKVCVSVPPKEGFGIEEMRIGMRIFDKIKKEDTKSFDFEEEEFNQIKKKVEEMRRARMSECIIGFNDYIMSVK